MDIARVSELNIQSHTEVCMYGIQGDPSLIRIDDVPIFVGNRHCVRRQITELRKSESLPVNITTCKERCAHVNTCHPIPLNTPEGSGVYVVLPKVEP